MATAGHPVDSLLEAVKRLPAEALAEFAVRFQEWQQSPGNGEPRQATPRDDPEAFLVRADRLDRAGHRNAALDLLYDRVDELMRAGQFDALDAVLDRAAINDLSVDVLLGLLTATLPARTRLKSRPRFFAQVEAALKERGEYEDGLLTGLE